MLAIIIVHLLSTTIYSSTALGSCGGTCSRSLFFALQDKRSNRSTIVSEYVKLFVLDDGDDNNDNCKDHDDITVIRIL